jgi:hypothetical protein
MPEPLSRLRRRPLLAPLWLPLIILLAAGAGIWWLGTWARTTVIVLVRHAEAVGASAADPDLSNVGEQRAAQLGEFLADALGKTKVDYLYAADTRRAQQTAAPIANQFGLPINLLASSDWEHLGLRITENDFGSVFIAVLPSPGDARLLRLHYGAPVPSPTIPGAAPAAAPAKPSKNSAIKP